MNYPAQGDGTQAGSYARYACAVCGDLTAEEGCSTLRIEGKPKGWFVFVCAACSAQAFLSPKFQRQLEMAADAGIPLYEVQRVFSNLGCEVPTEPHEFDAALRLPPGTAASMLTRRGAA